MPSLSEANMQAREGRVSASQVSILTGTSPWGSPLELFNWVYSGVRDDRKTPATEMGHLLEPVVLERGRQVTGRKVEPVIETLQHPFLPMAATLDAVVLGTDPRVPVEVKTTGGYNAEEWQLDPGGHGGVPEHYVDQVTAQMMHTGADHAYVWVLIGGLTFYERIVPFDVERADMIAAAVTRFYRDHVIPGIPPVDARAEHPVLFTIPEGTGAADEEMEGIGGQIAGLMGMQDGVKESLADERSRLIDRMQKASLRRVTGTTWSAELKAGKNGQATLRFNRTR